MGEDLWVFGYGSLIWRPSFEHVEAHPAHIEGFVRRFWQGSTDHRGTPECPGRVVTLIERAGERCDGMAFRVPTHARDEVIEHLDHRERGGYRRVDTELYLRRGSSVRGLVYIASTDNPNYLGPAPVGEIAHIVRTRRGPSGTNLEYVLRLARALDAIGAVDDHVAELAALLRD